MKTKEKSWTNRVGAEFLLRKAGATTTKKGKRGYNRKEKNGRKF